MVEDGMCGQLGRNWRKKGCLWTADLGRRRLLGGQAKIGVFEHMPHIPHPS